MCGIAGEYGHPDGKELIARLAESGQHRGKDACGIASLNPEVKIIEIAKEMGLVQAVFNSRNFIEMEGKAFISHVRWPTQGSNTKRNIQPHYTQGLRGRIVIAANGDVVNMQEQMDFLEKEQIRVYSRNDAEMMSAAIYWQIEKKGRDIVGAITKMMKHVKGAYSALFMADWEDALYAFRDPRGFRPLLFGILENRYVVVSETCQLDKVGAQLIREVNPGEIIRISDIGLKSFQGAEPQEKAFCSFEEVYFQRPDSLIYYYNEEGKLKNVSNYEIRLSLGSMCASEHPVTNADMIIPSPRSGIPAAIGYSRALNKQYQESVISEGGRTFIIADRASRKQKAEEKYYFITDFLKDKVIVIVDDSSIKTLTVQTLTQKARLAGVKEIHFRIASPYYKFPCYYGSETKNVWELAASDKNKDEFLRAAGSPDSIEFLSIEGFKSVIKEYGKGHCYACFDGNYPVHP